MGMLNSWTRKALFQLGNSELLKGPTPQQIHACLWDECKAESHMSSLPQRGSLFPYCLRTQQEVLLFHHWYSASSTACPALTTRLGIAASYSPAPLLTKFLSRTTPMLPARMPFWVGGKTQHLSLVTLGKTSEWYTQAGRSALKVPTWCRFGGLKSSLLSNTKQHPVYSKIAVMQSNEDHKNT